MSKDDMKIAEDIAERRNQGIMQQFSPSKRGGLVWVAAGGLFIIITIFFLAQRRPVKENTHKLEEHFTSQLMPREEVTPTYIAGIGRTEKQAIEKEEKEEKKEAVQKNIDAKREPAQLGSMMISASKGFTSLGLPTGTELFAVLEKTVVADDREVPVIARITKSFEWNYKIAVPQGSRLFGTTHGMVEDRIHVAFDKIVFPDGSTHQFSGIAIGDDGAGGIKGDVKRKLGKRGGGVVASALLGASTVFAPAGAGFGDAAIRGAQSGALGEISKDSNYYKRTEANPVVTIKASTRFKVLADRAI